MKHTEKTKVTPLIFETYLSVINNSVGSNTFRNFYATVNGEKEDIMRDGELSCAFFVSSILSLFQFIKEAHATVDSTVKDLQESGWIVVKKPEIGSVLVWEESDFGNNDIHKHIGFYIGKDQAVSNSYKLGNPIKHNLSQDTKRKIELILWNPKIAVKP